jgi:hypothetical protein
MLADFKKALRVTAVNVVRKFAEFEGFHRLRAFSRLLVEETRTVGMLLSL